MGRIRANNEENLPKNMYKKGDTYYAVTRTSPRKWIRLGKKLDKSLDEFQSLTYHDIRFSSASEFSDAPKVVFDGVIVSIKCRDVQDEILKIYKRTIATSKARSITNDLSLQDVEDMYLRSFGRCEVTGIPFNSKLDCGEWKSNPWTPSIDRIDSKKHYSKENCRLLCNVVNRAIGEWGDVIFGRMCKEYAKQIVFVEDM